MVRVTQAAPRRPAWSHEHCTASTAAADWADSRAVPAWTAAGADSQPRGPRGLDCGDCGGGLGGQPRGLDCGGGLGGQPRGAGLDCGGGQGGQPRGAGLDCGGGLNSLGGQLRGLDACDLRRGLETGALGTTHLCIFSSQPLVKASVLMCNKIQTNVVQ